MARRQRIAIYGGTFDPVHRGHLEIGRRVSELFDIDEFLFVPAQIAPHKLKQQVSPAFHRYAMLALATLSDEKLRISTLEIEGAGTRYTVDTLARFREQLAESVELFFVLGADSWAEITSWRDWKRLVTLATLVVVTRPGYEISAGHVDAEVAALIRDLQGLTKEQLAESINAIGTKIFFSDCVMANVSATEIRAAARSHDFEKLSRLVPSEVAEYIRKYQLYGNTHEATAIG
ncbi:MAG TPA: nicotinate-nucleotide adenylyltransferase [Pyrinomonadaceae bacterium]|nr:nicotinate-nucleotide adenylyltransferase [Pyrinomonadaceae bacterium]